MWYVLCSLRNTPEDQNFFKWCKMDWKFIFIFNFPLLTSVPVYLQTFKKQNQRYFWPKVTWLHGNSVPCHHIDCPIMQHLESDQSCFLFLGGFRWDFYAVMTFIHAFVFSGRSSLKGVLHQYYTWSSVYISQEVLHTACENSCIVSSIKLTLIIPLSLFGLDTWSI